MPDLQSELKNVLKESPTLRKPLNERVWLWLTGHPEKDSKHIAASLREPRSHIAKALHDLMCRGMLTRKSKAGYKAQYVYSALYANTAFELRPIRKLEKTQKLTAKSPETRSGDEGMAAPTDSFTKALQDLQAKPKLDVAKLPLKEAHEVYLQLKSYFEPKVL